MRRWLRMAAVLAVLLPAMARAEVFCIISDFQMDAYDHGGTYIHGTLTGAGLTSGGLVYFMSLCGSDCTSRAADRRLALAMFAKAQGKNLLAYFGQYTSCAQVQQYSTIGGLRTQD